MLPILKKELNTLFSSLMAYAVITFFLLIAGLLLWIFPGTNILDDGYATLQPFFQLAPYLFMLLSPAITMHLIAEEKKMGTLEMLLTTPLSPMQIIIGKYIASLVIISITLLLTTIYAYSIYSLSSPIGNIDTAALAGSYLGLALVAATFSAIGLLASSLTEHQIVAFLLSALLSFLLYHGLESWTILHSWKSYSMLLAQLGIQHHYEALSRGVIASNDIAYFIGLIGLLLGATRLALTHQR